MFQIKNSDLRKMHEIMNDATKEIFLNFHQQVSLTNFELVNFFLSHKFDNDMPFLSFSFIIINLFLNLS